MSVALIQFASIAICQRTKHRKVLSNDGGIHIFYPATGGFKGMHFPSDCL